MKILRHNLKQSIGIEGIKSGKNVKLRLRVSWSVYTKGMFTWIFDLMPYLQGLFDLIPYLQAAFTWCPTSKQL